MEGLEQEAAPALNSDVEMALVLSRQILELLSAARAEQKVAVAALRMSQDAIDFVERHKRF